MPIAAYCWWRMHDNVANKMTNTLRHVHVNVPRILTIYYKRYGSVYEAATGLNKQLMI